MRTLKHKNLLALEEVYETKNSFYLVFELFSAGNLKEIIREKFFMLYPKQIKLIFLGIMLGI